MRCTSCDLCQNPELVTNCMTGTGDSGVTFMLVGHQPGVEDDKLGAPFTGSNGRLLHALLQESSWNTRDCFFTNALKCSLFGGKPKESYWKRCKGHFKNELREIKPQAIVAFGGIALKWLTGFSGVRRFRKRGLPCLFNPEIMVYPFEQPISLQNYEGEDYHRMRAQMVSDLIWLRQRARAGMLNIADDIPTDYKRAKTLQDVRDFLDEFPVGSEVYADLETAQPDHSGGSLFPYEGHKIVAIGFSKGAGHARTIPYQARGVSTLCYWTDEEEKQIHEWLGEFWKTRKFEGHNFVQFDQKWVCVRWGLDKLDIPFESLYASHILDETPGSHGLEALAIRYTKMLPWKSTFSVKDTVKCCTYLAKDVDAGWRVSQALKAKLDDSQEWLHHNIQMPFGHVARRMEQRGVLVDPEAVTACADNLSAVIDTARKEISAIDEVKAFELLNGCRLNVKSPEQIADLMENYLKLECLERTETGKYSTKQSVLEYWEDKTPFMSKLLLHRRAAKLKSTYCDGIAERMEATGPIMHYSIKTHGTVTGRPSFADPNVGNIPRKDTAAKSGIEDPSMIKAMFVPRKGRCMLQADYSQAELRVLAMLSGDQNLIDTYAQGLDVHRATAAKLFQVPIDDVTSAQRSQAKAINFGIIYGKQEQTLIADFILAAMQKARKEGIEFTPLMEAEATAAAQAALAGHRKAHPDVWRWMSQQEVTIRQRGYQKTPFGRRRRYWKIDHASIRQAYNFPVQSTAADFTHIAIVRTHKILQELGLDAPIVLTVYDSIIFEPKFEDMWEVADVAKRVMEGIEYPWMRGVRLKVDLEAGLSWGRLRELDLENRVVLK